MANQGEILEQTSDLLWRPTLGQIRFSDVYSEKAGENEELWWRKTDFDADITDYAKAAGFSNIWQVPIGLRPEYTGYGLVFADDLAQSYNERVLGLISREQAARASGRELHRDALKRLQESSGAILALANNAPRNEANVADDKNGADFHLAITASGLEIYATPLDYLGDLEDRNRITALYQIPTKGHPEFNGDYEQFRSGPVVLTREHPYHIIPVFEYPNVQDLIDAKRNGSHPQVIPTDKREGRFAYWDKYGNGRMSLKNISLLHKLEEGDSATLQITNRGKPYELEVVKAKNLHSAPLGKLAIYLNCSDHLDEGSTAGLVEFIARVDDEPSTSVQTAIFKVLDLIPDLDTATAELKLAA